jgi:hypothetical protein
MFWPFTVLQGYRTYSDLSQCYKVTEHILTFHSVTRFQNIFWPFTVLQGYRTCSDLSQCYKVTEHILTCHSVTRLQNIFWPFTVLQDYRTYSDLSQCYKVTEHILTFHSVTRLQNIFWPVTVLQGSDWSLYSGQADTSSNTGVFLNSVGKCRTAKVNINFLVKLKKSETETFQVLTEAYGETKQQSVQWKTSSSPRPKKHAWVVRSSMTCWLFSLISTVLWWQSGYSAVRR